MELQDLRNELLNIREALNTLEVKGERNAALIVYGYNKCNALINALPMPASKGAEADGHPAES